MIWAYSIIGAILGIILCYIIMRPKQILDQETLQKNKELQKEHTQLIAAIASAETETSALEQKKASLNQDIQTISAQAKATTDEIYQKSYDLMQEKLAQSAELSAEKFRKAEEQAQQEYLDLLAENAKEAIETIETRQLELKTLEITLDILKEKARAAIEADKRKLLDEQAKNYYKINISDEDIEDIKMLQEVAKKLNKDPEPINKIIWESYYKKPTMDLLGRLVPTGQTHTGIYKITNIKTNQCYIGQSVDLRNRLRDHIKAGLGINSSNNKFYSELKTLGPEAFMYEIIEECPRIALNERERYWIDFYDSTNFGYNTTLGVNKND